MEEKKDAFNIGLLNVIDEYGIKRPAGTDQVNDEVATFADLDRYEKDIDSDEEEENDEEFQDPALGHISIKQ